MSFLGGSMVKNPPANEGDAGEVASIPGLIPWWGSSLGGGKGNPLQYSCWKKSHGQRILTGYSRKGHEELDTTE